MSRSWSEEDKKKKSELMKGRKRSNLTPEAREKMRAAQAIAVAANQKRYKERLENAPFDTLSKDARRIRILNEQNHSCRKCGIKDWQGEAITFEMEHIDGDNTNNERSNLEILCPNCHSQTSTWRGRNGGNKNKGVTNEMLLEALTQTNTIEEALKFVGLGTGGYNMKRAIKLRETMAGPRLGRNCGS